MAKKRISRRDFMLAGAACFTGAVVSACETKPTPPPPTPEPVPPTPTSRPEATKPTGKCGDGVCDEAESKDPKLCPQDCQARPTAAAAAPGGKIAASPNIVFVVTDDLSRAEIPHMPKLKSLITDQGTTFANFFISMPLCCPSRATILRGQYGHNTQIMGNDLPFGGFPKFADLGEEGSTIGTWLKDAGYRTMLAGKYLNAFPDAKDPMHIPAGWTEWYSPMAGEPYEQYDYTLNENGKQVVYGKKSEDYGTDVYLRKTLDFIQRSAQEGKPFFAHVGVYAPHYPYTPAPRHANLFADAAAPRTLNFNEADVNDKPSYIKRLPALTQKDIAQIDSEYRQRLRSLQAVDEMIEAIVNTLRSTGQLDNTYIFFTSDNGYHFGNHRQVIGKTAPYDEETRVTMIVRGPGVPAGKTLDHLTGNVDLAPTWAELAGVETPDFVDGRSLAPLLHGSPPPTSQWRQSFLLEHAPWEPPKKASTTPAITVAFRSPTEALEPPKLVSQATPTAAAVQKEGAEALPYRGVRTADYLYVEYPTNEKELYDLRNDPYQLENIATTANPQLLAQFASLVLALYTSSGQACRALEDKALAAVETVQPTPSAGSLAEPLAYYLGYATQDNMQWIEKFDVDVLTRGFLLFLNSTDAWIADYRSRMEACQKAGRQFLVALQAAVLVETAKSLPSLGANDPALAFPMDSIPEWEDLACRTPDGLTVGGASNTSFAHSCLNNADFREFLEEHLRRIVDSGANGVHIDELSTRYFTRQEGYCHACMEGFRSYLAKKYSAADLRSKFNITDIRSFDFRKRLAEEGNLKAPPKSTLHKEWWLFQLSSLAEREKEVLSFGKSYAQGLRREFIVTTNAYEPERNPDRAIEMTLTDYSSIGTGMTIRVRKGGKYVTPLRIPPSYSYVPLYRMAQGVTPDKAVTLFIDGPGGTSAMKELSQQRQRDIVRWMFAEAYAAGARFHVPYPSLDYYAPLDAVEPYVRFILENRKVYESASHLADVGILFSYASEIWDYWVAESAAEPHHSLQWYGLAQALTDMSVQYDVVFAPDGKIIRDNLTLDKLQSCKTLIVPWAYALSEAHVRLLEQYAKSGKSLVIVGDFATVDEEKNRRSTDMAARLRTAGATVVSGLDFEGYLADPRGQSAPGVVKQLTTVIPKRLVTVSNNNVTAFLDREGNALYCHLINKKLEDAGFKTQAGFRVKITLPSDLKLSDSDAVYVSPDIAGGKPATLRMTRQGDAVEVTVPNLEVYGVLVIPSAGYNQ